jgi:hypothetical protein
MKISCFWLLLQLLEGNINTYTPQIREVNPPIIARRLRFVPYSSNPRTVCMRVEVYGCPWDGKYDLDIDLIMILSTENIN